MKSYRRSEKFEDVFIGEFSPKGTGGGVVPSGRRKGNIRCVGGVNKEISRTV